MNPESNPSEPGSDALQIDQVTGLFFDLFTNTDNRVPNIRAIREFFIAEGLIINNTGDSPLIYDLDSFIEPREQILTDKTLIDFREYEVSHTTEIHGKIASRISTYKKSGILNGNYFKAEGIKILHFIKKDSRWMLSSVVWWDRP